MQLVFVTVLVYLVNLYFIYFLIEAYYISRSLEPNFQPLHKKWVIADIICVEKPLYHII